MFIYMKNTAQKFTKLWSFTQPAKVSSSAWSSSQYDTAMMRDSQASNSKILWENKLKSITAEEPMSWLTMALLTIILSYIILVSVIQMHYQQCMATRLINHYRAAGMKMSAQGTIIALTTPGAAQPCLICVNITPHPIYESNVKVRTFLICWKLQNYLFCGTSLLSWLPDENDLKLNNSDMYKVLSKMLTVNKRHNN